MTLRMRLKPEALRPVHPNAGVEGKFQAGLSAVLKAMERDVTRAVSSFYRTAVLSPAVTADAAPIRGLTRKQNEELDALIEELGERWGRRFAERAEKLTETYLRRAGTASARQMFQILKDRNFIVRPGLTPRIMESIRHAATWSSGLIKTIPRELLGRVKDRVIKCVENGRDIGGLERELSSGYGISQRRARMIAKDQTNKVTQDVAMAQCKDYGIHRGIWRHNAASKVWREEHVEMDGQIFDLALGCWDRVEGKYVMPGELVNCHCSFRPVIELETADAG